MTAIEIICLVLVLLGMVIVSVLMIAFEKIATNKRNITYNTGENEYCRDRVRVVNDKLSQLYIKDEYGFERPKVDLNQDTINDRLNEINKRLYDLEKH